MSAPPQFSSPMQPVAPPSKKIKAEVSVEGDETITRRRQELQRLREKTQQRMTPGASKAETNRTEGLLAQARSQLDGPPKVGPPISRPTAHPRGPPSAPPGAPLDRVRHSDIFPTVDPKVAPRNSVEPPRSRAPPPSRPNAPAPAKSQQERGSVARRLDPSFAQGRVAPAEGSGRAPPATGRTSPSLSGARAKSAPPSRPAPPPGPPPTAKEAPETTPSRGFASRPPPMTPGSNANPTGPPKPVETPKMSQAPTPAPVPIPVPTPAPKPVTTPFASRPPSTPGAFSGPSTASKPPETGARVGPPPTQGPPPTTSRKDMIRNLHQYADTPAKSLGAETPSDRSDGSGLLRMEKELSKLELDKTEALKKISMLEEQLRKLKEQGDPKDELDYLVQMAERDGANAAIQFARQKTSGTTPRGPLQVGFFSPKSPGLASPRANPRKRVATPHPKRDAKGDDDNEMENAKLHLEAVKYAPFEYNTDLATFLIRRPYGNATDKEFWFKAGYAPSKQYEKNADVKRPSTLEIVAQIKADGSMLSLHGESFVRHIGADVDADWEEFGNYDELDKPLGTVTYIDSDANDKDYSLDEVFEGALAARENYCTSVVSMGKGLKAKGAGVAVPPTPNMFNPAEEQKPKPQTSNACVGTEDLPYDPPAQKSAGNEADADRQSEQSAPPPPVIDEDDGMGSMFDFFVNLLLWVVKSILLMPVKALSFTLYSLIAFIVLSMLWLQFVDYHGAQSMGASMDFMYNRPGIV